MSGKFALREIIRKIQVNPIYYRLEPIDGKEELVELDLSKSRLGEIPKSLFTGLKYLRKLTLEYNDLTSLPPDVFRDLESLIVLNISKNSLVHLPQDLFMNNPLLERIDLSENRLSQLGDEGIHKLQHLKVLDLHRNKLGVYINGATDIFPPSLEKLNLRSNFIMSIGQVIDKLYSLKNLDLSKNQLMEFSTHIAPSLEVLKLNDNEIIELDVKNFVLMDNLRELYLQNNELTQVQVEAFQGKNLEILDLRGNPLNPKLRRLWEKHNLKEFFETMEIFG